MMLDQKFSNWHKICTQRFTSRSLSEQAVSSPAPSYDVTVRSLWYANRSPLIVRVTRDDTLKRFTNV